MIKIFRGGAGVVTPSKPLPPTNNFCIYPTPVLRCFWKDPLITPLPPPPHFKHPSLLPPSPSTTPSPPPPKKNFDHTLCPVAWLTMTKSCSYLSHFPGFLAFLKIWIFSKMSVEQTLYQSRLTNGLFVENCGFWSVFWR